MQRISHLKISSIIFPMVLMLFMLPMEANAYSAGYKFEYGGLRYTILNESSNTVACSGHNNGREGDIVIPEKVNNGGITYTVVRIDNYAFYGCTGLTSITIPNSVTAIDVPAFSGCSSLTSINVDAANQAYSSKDGVLYNKEQTSLISCPGGKLGEVIIPNSVTAIGVNAFSECTGLTSVTIPNSVTTIDYYAFYGCTGLTSITIPNSVTTIGDLAFSGCSSLTSINVDAANQAYSSKDGVLYNKEQTRLIRCPEGKLGKVIIPNSVTTIGESAFSWCSGLTSITIPNSVKTINDYAFFYCSSLTSITIPNSVTTIGACAFDGCTGLTSVTIPQSVESIEAYAFYDCYSLTSVYYIADEPIESTVYVFDSEIYNNATLYVPANAVNKCKQIDPWKNFKSIEAYDFAGVDDISVDAGADFPCEVYNINGVKIAESTDNLAPGIYIVRQGSNVKKIVVN